MSKKHMGNHYYAQRLGSVCGPGGLRCGCCIPFDLRHYKVFMRRQFRRLGKQEMKIRSYNEDGEE